MERLLRMALYFFNRHNVQFEKVVTPQSRMISFA